MKFIELHHGESLVAVRPDKVLAVTDICPDTAVHVEGYVFCVDESVGEVLEKIREAMA